MKTPKVGDIIACTMYLKVKKLVHEDYIETEDLDGDTPVHVQGSNLIRRFTSANEHSEAESMSRIEVAQLLVSAGDKPFTVGFMKKDGTMRHLTGVLISHGDLMGRSMVRDFDVKEGDPLRQVDHRTLVYLVLDGHKYNVRGAIPRKENEWFSRKM